MVCLRSVNLSFIDLISRYTGISITMPYWDERVAEKAKGYPDVKVEKYHASFRVTLIAFRL